MPETAPVSRRQVEAAQNQRLFRILNANLRLVPPGDDGPFAAALVCECADTNCAQPIEIAADEYELMRRHPQRFAVVPDHVFLDVERVVAWRRTYWIVEKSVAALAAADPHALPTESFHVEG